MGEAAFWLYEDFLERKEYQINIQILDIFMPNFGYGIVRLSNRRYNKYKTNWRGFWRENGNSKLTIILVTVHTSLCACCAD